jgi:hypothetical protein
MTYGKVAYVQSDENEMVGVTGFEQVTFWL